VPVTRRSQWICCYDCQKAELDVDIETCDGQDVVLYFRNQEIIPTLTQNLDYAIYYGATVPQLYDKENVYPFYDDFSQVDLTKWIYNNAVVGGGVMDCGHNWEHMPRTVFTMNGNWIARMSLDMPFYDVTCNTKGVTLCPVSSIGVGGTLCNPGEGIKIQDVEISEDSKGDFSYKEMSDISDLTEESFPEGMSVKDGGNKDIDNYDKLLEQTK